MWGLADKTEFAAVEIPEAFDVPCAPVMSMKKLPTTRRCASGSMVEVEQKLRGKYLTVGSPITFSAFTPKITGAPLLGEHADKGAGRFGPYAERIAELHGTKVV